MRHIEMLRHISVHDKMPCWYYPRVILAGGHMAWGSPIWINAGRAEPPTPITVRSIVSHPPPLCRPALAIAKRQLKGGRWVLALRFSSKQRYTFRGRLQIEKTGSYRVRPEGFAIVKYGGDLFTDNGHGLIRWDVTPASHMNPLDQTNEKGLLIIVRTAGREPVFHGSTATREVVLTDGRVLRGRRFVV